MFAIVLPPSRRRLRGPIRPNLGALGGFARLVRCLLRAGAAVDAADAEGWTPLMAAVWHRHDAAATALRHAGAREDLVTAAGQTVASLAILRQL